MKKRLAFLILFALMGSMAWSQTIIYVNAVAAGANNGTSWADAYKDLQVALNSAAAGSQIWVAAGTYKPRYDLNGTLSPNSRFNTFHFQTDVEVYGGFLGTETSLSQRVCNPSNPTVLSGDLGTIGDRNDNAIHVCYSEGLTAAFLIDCVTIRDAFGRFNNTDISGGGWYNDGQSASSNPTLRQCKFINNYGGRGGAFYNDGTNGGQANPEFVDCEFSNNTGAYGTGLCNDGSMGGESSPTVTNCLFLQNAGGHGGAIYNDGIQGNASGLFTNCEFSQNTAKMGGALYIAADDGTSRAEFNRCIFSGNAVLENGGAVGATAVNGDAKTTFTDCTFEYNTCDKRGGAVWNHGASPWFVTCLFLRNASAMDGGAMYNDGANGLIANPRVTSCDFSDNTSGTDGGAMYNQGTFGDASPLVVLTKFINNVASSGGAIYNYVGGNANGGQIQAQFYNCLFSRNNCQGRGAVAYNMADWGNCTPTFSSCSFSANSAGAGDLFYVNQINGGNCVLRSYNMASHGHTGIVATIAGGATIETFGGMYEAALGANCNGTCYLGVDPLFTNPASDDLTLQAGSPAIDLGLNAWILPQYPVDLAGNTRIQGGTVDLGAYETPFVPPCPRVIYVNKIATGANNGTSWADAYIDLQSALAEARINPCTDTILIAKGVYKPTNTTSQYFGFELVDDIEMYGGFPNTGNPWFPQRNLVTYETILSGDIGVVGNPNDNTLWVLSAGRMPNMWGTVSIGSGTIVDGLSVVNGQGGFQGCLSAPGSYCSPVFRDVRFYNNNSQFLQGSAVHFFIVGSGTFAPPVQPLFEHCEFENNVGTQFGAVGFWSNTAPSSTHLAPRFKECKFIGNSSANRGGAVGILGTAAPIFEECLFQGNHVTGPAFADGGGVIDCKAGGSAPSSTHIHPVFRNCRMSDNHSSATGGIAYFVSYAGNTVNMDFTNCTITGSEAFAGGLVSGSVNGSSTINFDNCIIWNTNGTWWQGHDILDVSASGNNSNAVMNFRNTLIDAASCANGTRMWRMGPYTINCGPGMLYNVNPQFVNPVAGNYSLSAGSPAINAGSNALVLPSMTTDIAGNNRIHIPSGGIVDMGCYENFPGMVLRTAAPGSSAESDNAAEAVAKAPQDILVFPNPVSNVLHLELGGFECKHGVLLDAMGKVVKEWTGNATEIDMGSLAAGVYVLRLEGKDDAVMKRVVKE